MSAGIIVIWFVIIVLIGVSSSVRKRKEQEAREKKKQQASMARAAGKQTSRPNPIVEKAKQNTQDVHRAHVEHEKKSQARGYGGTGSAGKQAGNARPAARNAGAASRSDTAAPGRTGTAFGSPDFGPAPSGVPAGEEERFSEKRERLLTALQQERMGANSRSGRNRIMEAAKENALETSLDNLMDSRRDFIKEVQELMITGPDVSLPNQRDFVSEGTEMVNRALMTLY